MKKILALLILSSFAFGLSITVCSYSTDQDCADSLTDYSRKEFLPFLENSCANAFVLEKTKEAKVSLNSEFISSNCFGESSCYDPNTNTVYLSPSLVKGKSLDDFERVLAHAYGHVVSNAIDPLKDVGGKTTLWQPIAGNKLSAQHLSFEEAEANLFAMLYLKSKGSSYNNDLQEISKSLLVSNAFKSSGDRISGVITSILYYYYSEDEPSIAFGDFMHAISSQLTFDLLTKPARSISEFELSKNNLLKANEDYPCRKNEEFSLSLLKLKDDEYFYFESPTNYAGNRLIESKRYSFAPGNKAEFYYFQKGEKKMAVFDSREPAIFSVANKIVSIERGRVLIKGLSSQVAGVKISHQGTSYIVEKLEDYTKITVVDGSVIVTDALGDAVEVNASEEVDVENGVVSTPTALPNRLACFAGLENFCSSTPTPQVKRMGIAQLFIPAIALILLLIGMALIIKSVFERENA